MTYAIRYRCRRCDIEFDHRDDSWLRSSEHAKQAAKMLKRGVSGGSEIHECADGSFGVADLVGVAKLQGEEKKEQPQ